MLVEVTAFTGVLGTFLAIGTGTFAGGVRGRNPSNPKGIGLSATGIGLSATGLTEGRTGILGLTTVGILTACSIILLIASLIDIFFIWYSYLSF